MVCAISRVIIPKIITLVQDRQVATEMGEGIVGGNREETCQGPTIATTDSSHTAVRISSQL